MIDEKKLIEKISRMRENAALYRRDISQICENLLCELNDFITELPKVGEWIPVSERLPEESGVYLRTCDAAVEMVAFDPDEEFDVEEWKSVVTAWMPLPEPWEGEK